MKIYPKPIFIICLISAYFALLPNISFGQLTISEESTRRGQAFWGERLSKCGDFYYAKHDKSSNIIQFRGLMVNVLPWTTSDADRLNGYEYRGIIHLQATEYRQFSVKNGVWESWKSLVSPLRANRIYKLNGNWTIETTNESQDPSLVISKISCNDALTPQNYSQRINQETRLSKDREILRSLEARGFVISQTTPLPMELLRDISENRYRGIKNIIFPPDGGWITLDSEGFGYSYNVSQELAQTIKGRLNTIGLVSVLPDNSSTTVKGIIGFVDIVTLKSEYIAKLSRPELFPNTKDLGILNGKVRGFEWQGGADRKYPTEAIEKGIEGIVSVQILQDKNGKTISLKVTSGNPIFHNVTINYLKNVNILFSERLNVEITGTLLLDFKIEKQTTENTNGEGWIITPKSIPRHPTTWITKNISTQFIETLDELNANRISEGQVKFFELRSIAFRSNEEWLILYSYKKGEYLPNYACICQEEIQKAMNDLVNSDAEIKKFGYSPNGGWIILHGRNGFVTNNLSEDLVNELNRLNEENKEIRNVFFAPSGAWIILIK